MGIAFPARLLALTLALLAGMSAVATAADARAPQADRDGDGVYDDLEARAESAPDSRALRVIVALERPPTRSRVRELAQDVQSLNPARRFSLVDSFAATVDAGQVRKLAADRRVAFVERDAPVKAFNSSAQSAFGVSAARTQDADLDGAGLSAAVIDTGIDAEHPNLDDGKVVAFQDFTELSYDAALDAAYDDEGHGTHVAATIAGDGDGSADGRGVAPAAGLVGLKVLDASGSGYTSDVIAAIEWATANSSVYGIEVINMSLGSDGCSDGTGTEAAAIDAAVLAGIVVAAAAGNEGPERCTIGAPGATESAITVGAMADTGVGGFFMADFSSRGETADGRVKPDIAAPGVRIRSADADIDGGGGDTRGYATFSGTSMATPFVAGVALLMRDANPALSPADVKSMIKSSAIDWGRGGDGSSAGTTGADADYGAGRLDAHAALAAAGASVGAAPAAPDHQLVEGSLPGATAVSVYDLTASGSEFPLAVTLTLGPDAASADFDMYLYDADGNGVEIFNSSGRRALGATTPLRQDAFWLPPATPRPYTLEVVSDSGAGNFFLDVSGGSAMLVAPVVEEPVAEEPVAEEPVVGAPAVEEPAVEEPVVEEPVAEEPVAEEPVVAEPAAEEPAAEEPTAPAPPAPAPAPLVIEPLRPFATRAPAIRGRARRGRLLTAYGGIWAGTQPLTFAIQWLRCGRGGKRCREIAGATKANYQPGKADLGRRLRVRIVATNAAGSRRASSVAKPVVRRLSKRTAKKRQRRLSVEYAAGA